MTRILKYKVDPREVIHVMVGLRAKVIHVAEQHQSVTFWMEVPAEEPGTSQVLRRFEPMDEISVYPSRRFVLLATGERFDERYYRYCGTALCAKGSFVWHLCEVIA